MRQARLRRRAMHGRDAKMSHQPIERVFDRLDQSERKRLNLVQNHHAFRNSVKLSQIALPICVERLKELHAGSHDNRAVPVFYAMAINQAVGLGVDVAMVFKNRLVSEDRPEDLHRLINDAGVRNHNNHATETVVTSMTQGE